MPDARYDGAATWYDELAIGFTQPFARVLAARAAALVEPGDVVVDIGCGTGLCFGALQEHPRGRCEAIERPNGRDRAPHPTPGEIGCRRGASRLRSSVA
jgi:hypothetical protein